MYKRQAVTYVVSLRISAIGRKQNPNSVLRVSERASVTPRGRRDTVQRAERVASTILLSQAYFKCGNKDQRSSMMTYLPPACSESRFHPRASNSLPKLHCFAFVNLASENQSITQSLNQSITQPLKRPVSKGRWAAVVEKPAGHF